MSTGPGWELGGLILETPTLGSYLIERVFYGLTSLPTFTYKKWMSTNQNKNS